MESHAPRGAGVGFSICGDVRRQPPRQCCVLSCLRRRRLSRSLYFRIGISPSWHEAHAFPSPRSNLNSAPFSYRVCPFASPSGIRCTNTRWIGTKESRMHTSYHLWNDHVLSSSVGSLSFVVHRLT